MKLDFEKWYEEKIINNEAKKLFNESCLCYKVGAYRAAFLMTYLGFQNILKERLLKSEVCPQGIPQSLWKKTQEDLLDDKKWDDAVFDSVNRIKPSNPFLINDDIRKQYEYFRCIRNDCAHAKSNIISYPHVESLWLFIQSNYNKFVVNGGRKGLLERISIHYNPIYTKPGSDINPIIEDIITSMNVNEIPLFLKDVYELSRFSFKTLKGENYSDFWNGIVYSLNSDLREGIIIFAKDDWSIFLKFINLYPDKLMEILLNSSSEFKREFWSYRIFKMDSYYYPNRWEILKKVLENNIIPSDELNNFITKLAIEYMVVPPKDYLEFFKSIGYLDELKRMYFGSYNKFDYPNGIYYADKNWSKIRELIINIDLDYEIVSQLNRVFVPITYGIYYNGMRDLLKDNENFRRKYKKVLINEGCEVPSYIIELEEN